MVIDMNITHNGTRYKDSPMAVTQDMLKAIKNVREGSRLTTQVCNLITDVADLPEDALILCRDELERFGKTLTENHHIRFISAIVDFINQSNAAKPVPMASSAPYHSPNYSGNYGRGLSSIERKFYFSNQVKVKDNKGKEYGTVNIQHCNNGYTSCNEYGHIAEMPKEFSTAKELWVPISAAVQNQWRGHTKSKNGLTLGLLYTPSKEDEFEIRKFGACYYVCKKTELMGTNTSLYLNELGKAEFLPYLDESGRGYVLPPTEIMCRISVAARKDFKGTIIERELVQGGATVEVVQVSLRQPSLAECKTAYLTKPITDLKGVAA